MSLAQTVKTLGSIAKDAEGLFEVLKGLAKRDQDTSQADRKKLLSLADNLAKNARKGARERRGVEIARLNKVIAAHTATLSVAGLDSATRQSVRAARTAAIARRGRLRGQRGLDFSGILSGSVAAQLASLLGQAKRDVRNKRKAAAFVHTAVRISDLALGIAGKIAA